MKNQITKQNTQTIRGLIETPEFKNQIGKLVGNPHRFVRIAVNQLLRTPQLAECDRASFINCLMQAAQLGIEPDGRNAHLIPFRSGGKLMCTLILDYKGLVQLALRGGKYTRIYADTVCEGDEFEFDRGMVTKHKINIYERGEIFGAYAFAVDSNGQQVAVYMTRKEIDSIRSRSRAGNSGPWVSDYPEMCKKTAFKRLSKWLLLEPEAADAIEADNASEFSNAIDIETAVVPQAGHQPGDEAQHEAQAAPSQPDDNSKAEELFE